MAAEVASIAVYLSLLGVDKFQADMRGAGTISEQTGVRVARSIDGISTATVRAARASEGMNRGDGALRSLGLSALRAETSVAALTKGLTAAGAAVGGLAGGVALNAFKNYADAATTIANKLAVVIPIQSQRAAIDQEVFNIAQRTRTQYESTASIFSRMSLSSKELGATQADVLRVVETTQKALKAGGATSSEAASIATQLTQALGSGRGLAGDELKSIAENSPILLQAIATEFGVTTGALKDMGAAGQLEAKRVFDAIKKAGTEVDRVFAEATPTIADGIQQIDNALTRYIGNVDKSLGATKALTQGLTYVANNISGIGDAAGLAIAALGASLIGRGATKATKAVIDPFKDARARAAQNLEDAEKLQVQRYQERTKAFGSAILARLKLQEAENAPVTSLAGSKAIADLMAAEKKVQGQRESLEQATKKVADAEARRNAVAAETVTASKATIQGEERAAAAILKTREALGKGVGDYGTRAGAIGTAAGELPKRAAEKLAEAVKERETLQAKLKEVDARAAATQADLSAATTPVAGARTRARAQQLAAMEADLKERVDSRNATGRALQEAIRIANEKEGALEAANVAARAKAADEVERIGARLVSAETAVVKAREELAARALRTAPGGMPDVQAARGDLQARLAAEEAVAAAARQDLAAKAAKTAPGALTRTVPTVLKYIEAEIEAQERLAVADKAVAKARGDLSAFEAKNTRSATNVLAAIQKEIEAQDTLAAAIKKRDGLSATYLDAMSRAPQASGSLGPADVKALGQAREARKALMAEFDKIDAEIEAKTAERNARAAAIGPRSQKNLGRDAANSGRVGELNAALAAATTERESITKRVAVLDERIVSGEQDLARRTQEARQKTIDGAVASSARLREIQGTLTEDLDRLKERRKVTIASEVANEQERASRLKKIDSEIAENRTAQTGIQKAIQSSDTGVQKARQAVELDAKGQRAAAATIAAEADVAIAASRKATEEVAATVARAQKAATITGIVSNVARSSLTALGGLVNLLGGPFAATLTAVSVGLAGYAIYQARAAEEVKKHADAVKTLEERTKALNDAQGAGKIRNDRQIVQDANTAKNAVRSLTDEKNGLRDSLQNALRTAAPSAQRGAVQDEFGGLDSARATTVIDDAAKRAGTTVGELNRQLDAFPRGSSEAADSARRFADVLLDAAKADPRLAERAIEADDFAKRLATTTDVVRKYELATKAAADVKLPTPLDADVEYKVGDKFNPESANAGVKAYLEEIGDQIRDLNNTPITFNGVAGSTEEIRGLAVEIGAARAQMLGLVSGAAVPVPIGNAIEAFKTGKTTAAEYGATLQGLKEKYPDFGPLIQSLIDANERELKAQATAAALGAELDGLNGRVVDILIKIGVQGAIPDIAALAAKEQAKADKVVLGQESKNRIDSVRAQKGDLIAEVLEARGNNPALDVERFTRNALEAADLKRSLNNRMPDLKEAIDTSVTKSGEAVEKVVQDTLVTNLKAQGKKRDADLLVFQRENPTVAPDLAKRLVNEKADADEALEAYNKSLKPAKKPKAAKKSQDQKDGETLAKKLQELDQDARVAGLDSFDQKTVRFAQNAKVATDQIESFINAARSGDMSNLPPTMQAIYEKMQLLEGVKLAKTALDEIYPYRKLARELQELQAAANASPEIAANIDLITMRVRADNAPEWAKGLTSGVKDAAKSIADGTATIGSAMESLKTKIIGLALDQAFKPFETAFQGSFAGEGEILR